MSKRILITSFDPFSGNFNASRQLAQAFFAQGASGCEHLPLTVDDAGIKRLKTTLNNSPPDGLILIGESTRVKRLRLESRANPIPLWLVSSSAALNRFLVVLHRPIHLLWQNHELSSWFVRGPCQSLNDETIEIKDSELNYFYCNAAYRVALQWADQQSNNPPVAFVHVPKKELPEPRQIAALRKLVVTMQECIGVGPQLY